MARFQSQALRENRPSTSLQTISLVILVTTAVTVLAGYGVCCFMLLATHGADVKPFANYEGTNTKNSQKWEDVAFKRSGKLLMGMYSTPHMHLLKQQQAAANDNHKLWAQFWASDAPQGQLSCMRQHRTACLLANGPHSSTVYVTLGVFARMVCLYY
jgi:hypothetical protein